MWTKRKKILFICYKIFAAWLPISQRSKIAKYSRYFWAKKILKYCGQNVNIERNAYFTPELSIGNDSGVGINCEIFGQVNIGNDVMMGPEVIIYTSGHNFNNCDIPMRLQGGTDVKCVNVGNDVWIGRRVIIMPGVSIGNGCVIGAGAVVTHDIPDYCVAAGIPEKIIKYRNNIEVNDR